MMPLIIKIWLALEGDSGGTRLTSHINLSNDRDLYDLRQCRIIKKYAGSVSLPGSTNWLIWVHNTGIYYIILHTMETGVSDDLFDNIQGENNHLAKQGQVLRGCFY